MMSRLNKHALDFDCTLKYFKETIDNANELSSKLLKIINFKNGCFFTLLPDDANFQCMYNFKNGGVLVQNPEEKYLISGRIASYSVIPTIRECLSKLILNKIKSNNNISCIFDDILRSSNQKLQMDLFRTYGLHYENEVYYQLVKQTISEDLIKKCLRKSNAFWHSLCVLTRANFKDIKNKELSLAKIDEVCLKSELIFVGAYDGEGYIFWEKNSFFLF
jgi:hypothetical protein